MFNKWILSGVFIVAANLGCAREGNPYARIKAGSFEVASKTFVPVNGVGPKITLLGAVHIGEKSYYEQLQRRLDRADIVLFEHIGLPEEKVEVDAKCPHFNDDGGGHTESAQELKLETQTQNIRHGRHFVHADIGLSELYDLLNVAPGRPICERLSRVPSKNTNEKEKNKLIETDVKRSAVALALVKSLGHEREYADETEKIILFHRNKAVIKRLCERLPGFKASQEIMIFYGAAHMPDIENSLEEMGYMLDNSEWLAAFSL